MCPRRAIPDNVQNDTSKPGVVSMTMRAPIGSGRIDFDVTSHGRTIAKLDHSPMEIGPSFVIPKTRMEHTKDLAIAGMKPVPSNALVLPNPLQ
tara:strand:- start:371 stop:649 length:279 start_codon:yes stop_codon:yes gene_type:complete